MLAYMYIGLPMIIITYSVLDHDRNISRLEKQTLQTFHIMEEPIRRQLHSCDPCRKGKRRCNAPVSILHSCPIIIYGN